jgi:mono/diheme cytochrome c family protein
VILYLYRLVGAAVLDGGVYEAIEADSRATRQAALTVVLASFAAGLGAGGVWRPDPAGFAVATLLALAAWLAWAMLMFQIGTWVLPGRQTVSSFGELLRTVGFAAAPGFFLVFAVLPGMAVPVFAFATAWMFAAMVVGVRHALDYPGNGRALAVCALAAALVLVLVVVVGLLFGPALASSSAHHRDHIVHVRGFERAVMRGDHSAARREAQWLADHADSAGDSDAPAKERAAYTRALAAAATAADAGAAAQSASAVFVSCGDCHRASGLTPDLDWPAEPLGAAIASHMLRDGRSATLLMQGLALPSDERWEAGVQSLRQVPLAPGDFPVSNRIGKAMHEVDAAVRRLGAVAATATTPDDRARAYGTLVAGCSSCHTRHRTLW